QWKSGQSHPVRDGRIDARGIQSTRTKSIRIQQISGLVSRIVSSFYSGISKYFLPDQRSKTAHSGAYVRLMMMKSWRKRCRNTYRNLGFVALSTSQSFLTFRKNLTL